MENLQGVLKKLAEKNNLIPLVNKSTAMIENYVGKFNCLVCKKEFEVKTALPYKSFISEYCEDCRKKRIEEQTTKESEVSNEEKEKQDKMHKERLLKKLIESSLPPKYHLSYPESKNLNELYNRNIFIYGKNGTGKSVFASNIAKEYMKRNIQVEWISFPKFIMQLQSSYRDNEENPFLIAEEVAGYNGVLFIDDLGAEKLTDYVRQIIYFILNDREEYQRLTVITSNFSLSMIDEQIDTRVSSRISLYKIIEFTGKDKRTYRPEIKNNP